MAISPVVNKSFREVEINENRKKELINQEFVDNAVVTSLYTPWNFAFKNLFKQFKRLANCYFLIICFLQTIPSISITGGVPTTILPLMFVLFVTALKDGNEDYHRHQADHIENNRVTNRYPRGKREPEKVLWRDVVVGDIIEVRNREIIPADLVLIKSSDSNGLCYVMTANLDGETNLKLRQVHAEFCLEGHASDLKGTVECDLPNKYLERFQGAISVGGERTPLGVNNVVLRGTQLRNTEWVLGVAVYTGHQTKIQMNAAQTPFKTSSLTRFTNQETLRVFMLQLLLCVVGGVLGGVWAGSDAVRDSSYLWMGTRPEQASMAGWTRFWTLIIIFTNFIPISLLVSMDMIKFMQAYMMTQDLQSYHAETDTPLLVRSSELNEELGLVEHLFSDKTGTLTCNVMEFRKCSIAGRSYGLGTTEIGRNVMLRRGITAPETPLQGPNDPVTPYVNFVDPSLNAVLSDPQHPSHAAATSFFTHLALNHDVMPERINPADPAELSYSASSPDEGALCWAARHFGFVFCERTSTHVVLQINGQPVEYKILHTIPFSSERKRSSVLVERPDRSLILYCKGADNVIKARLRTTDVSQEQLLKHTRTHLDQFCDDGLRTLLLAETEVDREWYTSWAQRHHVAETSMERREEMLALVADEIERDLSLVGATAIEDKLQDGVSKTIRGLREAGIKVWVLTGDKVDTAINIGFACSLLTPEMPLLRCCGEDGVMKTDEMGVPLEQSIRARLEDICNQLQSLKQQQQQEEEDDDFSGGGGAALVIDTTALEAVTHHGLSDLFLQVCDMCSSVLCARVSPDQKREIVAMVRQAQPKAVTLAVGDGANDVPMIQTAHVGVGISGQEGLQAVNNSDYAIGQFRFLQRLLLVHGRWSYRRSSVVTMYMFYKNALLVLPQFYFGFYNLHSGQNMYYDGLYQLFNMAYTALPVIALGVFDQDLSAASQLRFPALYREGVRGAFLSRARFWSWMAEAVVHSIVVLFVPLLTVGMGVWEEFGRSISLWDLGTLVNLCVVTVAHVRLALETRYWFVLSFLLPVLSYAFWWFTLVVFSGWLEIASSVYGSMDILAPRSAFWYSNILSVVVCAVISLAIQAESELFRPRMHNVVAEIQKGYNQAGVKVWEADVIRKKTLVPMV